MSFKVTIEDLDRRDADMLVTGISERFGLLATVEPKNDLKRSPEEKLRLTLEEFRENDEWSTARREARAIINAERSAAEASVPTYAVEDHPLTVDGWHAAAGEVVLHQRLTDALIQYDGPGATARTTARHLVEAGWHL